MKPLSITALSLLAAVNVIPAIASAAEAPVPCETMLKDVSAALKTTKAGDADKGPRPEICGLRGWSAARPMTTQAPTSSLPRP